MKAHIQVVSPTEVESLQAELVEVYRRAFRERPYAKTPAEVEEFARNLPIHAGAAGFRLVVAVSPEKGRAVGFSYGRTAVKGQPWYEVVESVLRPAGLAGWLIDAYQMVEMAVMPAAQGQGIGGRLHDRLLEDLPHRRAVLTTMAAETAAYRLYASKGWRMLLEEFAVPHLPRPYRIMGLELRSARVPAG